MKIKLFILALILSIPLVSQARLTDDEESVYVDALTTGKVKVVQKYLDGNAGINDQYFGWTALQMAANKGQLAVVKLLVEKGADINFQHPVIKHTALHLAAFSNHTDVANYLISKGADPDIKLLNDVSIVAELRDLGNPKMADLLLAAGAKE
jgi:ankyrin repeat protein